MKLKKEWIEKIQLLVFDFDGVFTENSVWISEDGKELVKCNRSDGIGLKKLRSLGLEMAILSSEPNLVVQHRAKKLQLQCWHGVERKHQLLQEIVEAKGISLQEVAYVGNDLNDKECLQIVGLPIVVADAHPDVRELGKIQTSKLGGQGALREICDTWYNLLYSNNGDTMEKKNIPVPRFPEAESVGPREWGEELLLVLSSGKYTMKKLNVKSGKKGGLQYHREKDEASYIVSGKLLLRYDDGSGQLAERIVGPGDWFHFPPGCVHQEEAITDVERIEVSTPHFNDRVRMEEEYGLPKGTGLPTTKTKDIVIK